MVLVISHSHPSLHSIWFYSPVKMDESRDIKLINNFLTGLPCFKSQNFQDFTQGSDKITHIAGRARNSNKLPTIVVQTKETAKPKLIVTEKPKSLIQYLKQTDSQPSTSKEPTQSPDDGVTPRKRPKIEVDG